MKKTFFKITVTLITFLTIFTSCNNEETLTKDVSDLNINKKTIKSLKTINSIKSKIENDNNMLSRIENTYDFENAELVNLNTSQDTAIVVKSLNYNETNQINTSLIIGYDEEEAGGDVFVMEINNVNKNNSLIVITIKTLDNEIYSKIVLDNLTNTKTINNYDLSRRKPCGQAVMDCIDDGYTNHGWISVALGITTAIVPHTFAVAVAACYDRNCK